jgi:hypothetical protein
VAPEAALLLLLRLCQDRERVLIDDVDASLPITTNRTGRKDCSCVARYIILGCHNSFMYSIVSSRSFMSITVQHGAATSAMNS